MVLTDSVALAARRDLADRLKQRSAKWRWMQNMEAEKCWTTTFWYRFMMVCGRELENCRPYVSICIHYDIPSVRLILSYHHLLRSIMVHHHSLQNRVISAGRNKVPPPDTLLGPAGRYEDGCHQIHHMSRDVLSNGASRQKHQRSSTGMTTACDMVPCCVL